jgi:hypothetical protein
MVRMGSPVRFRRGAPYLDRPAETLVIFTSGTGSGGSEVVRLVSESCRSDINRDENAYLYNRSGSLRRAPGIRGQVKPFLRSRSAWRGDLLPARCKRRIALAMVRMPPVAANFGWARGLSVEPGSPKGQVALWVTSARSPRWSWPGGFGAWPMALVGLGVCMACIQGLSCPTTCLEGRELDGPYGCLTVASVNFVAVPSG